MRHYIGKLTDDGTVFMVNFSGEALNVFLEFYVRLSDTALNGYKLPIPAYDAICIIVYSNIEAAYLIGADSRLGDKHIVDCCWLLQNGMRVAPIIISTPHSGLKSFASSMSDS